jgi:hypothetical protein
MAWVVVLIELNIDLAGYTLGGMILIVLNHGG